MVRHTSSFQKPEKAPLGFQKAKKTLLAPRLELSRLVTYRTVK